MIPALSILTPSIPSRFDRVQRLCAELERQIGDRAVEHLVFMDNKRRTVGEKREALLHMAKGEYIAFVDDDDKVSDYYVQRLLEAMSMAPDVVTFQQMAHFTSAEGVTTSHHIRFVHGGPNKEPGSESITPRAAWHVCAWSRDIALLSHFPSINYGEDWAWAEPLNRMALREVNIPAVLHEYHYDSSVSEAQP